MIGSQSPENLVVRPCKHAAGFCSTTTIEINQKWMISRLRETIPSKL